MKKVLTLIALSALALGSAQAGCGKSETTEGELKSFDASTKKLVVGSKTLTLTPSSKGADGADKLVGKKVKVVSEHGKVTSIAGA